MRKYLQKFSQAKLKTLFVFYITLGSTSYAQTSPFLDSLLKATLPQFTNVLENPNKYKLQIIYSRINRNEENKPTFRDFKFHVNKNYFYPASTVKLPISTLALIKLEELNVKGLGRETTMITDSAYYCQKKIRVDTTSASRYPTLENYIKKMFLVSDNYSCARVYEFVGHDYAHKKLEELGFKNVRLFNRLDGSCPGDTAKVTPPIYFLNEAKDTIYKQPLTLFKDKLMHPIPNSKVGNSHTGPNGKPVYGPKDFSSHNYLTPNDLHNLMKKIVFNDFFSEKEKLPISSDSRKFMLKQLGMYPKESEHPKYDKKIFYDTYKKYFLYASAVATVKQDSIRMFNIVGRAYGFLIDCAYIVDYKNKIEYLLTSSIYVNEKNVVGNGKYEYDLIGLPFLRDLSWSIYNFERTRPKEHLPDLSEFRLFD
ncbi:MAG: serine hydrolase [Bacteroidetes bacterium]|nr:serine hydrolase [Bacteroidota bacterium]